MESQNAQTGVLIPFEEDILIHYYCGQELSVDGEPVWDKQGDYYIINIIFTLLAK